MTKIQFVKSMNQLARAYAETAMGFAMTPSGKLPSYYPAPGGMLLFDDQELANFCSMETLRFAQSRATHFLYRLRQTCGKAYAEVCDNMRHAGQDLFLTPGGAGAGFWDGDWQEGDALCEVCSEFCEVNSEFWHGLVRIDPA